MLRLARTGVTGFEKFSDSLDVLTFSTLAVAGGVAGGVFKCKELKFSKRIDMKGKYNEAILAWCALRAKRIV